MKITMTPDMAREILKKNTKNRALNKGHVRRLADEIKQGKWSYTGDAIKVSSDDILVDGQHRLEAIILSGTPVPIELVTGVDTDSFSKVDTGLKRTAGHVIAMSGMTNPNNVAAIARIMININENGGINPSFSLPAARRTNAEISNMAIEIYDEIIESRIIPKMCKERITTPTQAALFYLYQNNNKKIVAEFIDHIANGLFTDRDDPCKRLRDKLNLMSGSSSLMFATIAMALTFKAWNAYVQGKITKKLSYSMDKPFPVPIKVK